jgi:hypothetical protein
MQSRPAFARLRRLRGVASVVVLGLLCRSLIPAGFMPAAIGEGGPVAVCHGGLAGEFFRRLEAPGAAEPEAFAGHGAHAAHGGQADHGAPAPAADHEGWEHCPFGAAFGAALPADDVAPELPTLVQAFEIVEATRPAAYRPASSYRARAPPSPAIHS